MLTVAGFLTVPRAASAQSPGVEVGVSADPGQFFFGGHIEMGPVADRVWFRPGLEVGVGNDTTLAAFNFELIYRARARRADWQFYGGGGPALNVYRQGGDTNPGGGFNIVLGAQNRRGLFSQVKVGLADSPSFRFAIGYTFKP